MALKPDAKDILAHMRGLSLSLGLDGARRWWPEWLFRSDHVENTAAILNRGKLFSRAVAERQQLIVKDSGSPSHIAQLTSDQRHYVRLYFRPRTPTQYANEGIRPKQEIKYDAHMPVPVYLLFSIRLLMEKGVQFTRGRLEESSEIGETVEFLKQTNFKAVYHDSGVGALGTTGRSDILNARHAEVLIKDKLSLDTLKHIVCRSSPERDTLLNLLTVDARAKWINRIIVDEGRRRLFYKRGTFVQDVNLSATKSRFTFYSNIDKDWRKPFGLQIEWKSNDWNGTHTNPQFIVEPRPLDFDLGSPKAGYQVRVTFNNDLAYQGVFDGSLPTDTLL